MTVSIKKEWFFPENLAEIDEKGEYFYIATIQKQRHRYLKIGTTERPPGKRFRDADYRKYSTVKVCYVAQIESDKPGGCYHVEDLTRSALRETKGLTFIKNDRFRYFQLPDEVPIQTSLTENHPVRIKPGK